MEIQVTEMTDTFVYGRLGISETNKIYAAAQKTLEEEETQQGEVGNDGDVDSVDRQSTIAWMNKGKKVKKMVDDFVEEINNLRFQEDISGGSEPFQITCYADENDHYDWHQDYYMEEEERESFVRTLSLSICLSRPEDYKGAEFMIKDGCEQNVRMFKMQYGDFIIFPSENEHKVNALRDGSRLSVVVWYGHEEIE